MTQETYLSGNKMMMAGHQSDDEEDDDVDSAAEGASDSHNTSETPKSHVGQQSALKKEMQNEFMGHDETRYANRIKILLGVIFLLTMVGVVTAIYVAMSKGETSNFEQEVSAPRYRLFVVRCKKPPFMGSACSFDSLNSPTALFSLPRSRPTLWRTSRPLAFEALIRRAHYVRLIHPTART